MADHKYQRTKKFLALENLAEEFAKIGIKFQSPKISGADLRKEIIKKWNLNNFEEQWERQKLLKKL